MNYSICDLNNLHLFCRAINKLYQCASIYGCGQEGQCKHCPLIIVIMAKELIEEKKLSVADAVKLSVENSEQAVEARVKIRKILAKEFSRRLDNVKKQ